MIRLNQSYFRSKPKLSARDVAFKAVMDKATIIALNTGTKDPRGFSHAVLWADIKIGEYTRQCLITCSENFSNWTDVKDSIRNQCPEVLNTFLNWD